LETWRLGDLETWRLGDLETWRLAEEENLRCDELRWSAGSVEALLYREVMTGVGLGRTA
jgi:hypothetical protein